MVTLSETDYARLHNSVEASIRKYRPFVDHALAAVREYVGYEYGDNGASEKVPFNYLAQFMKVHQRFLAPRNPKALITTPKPELKAAANDLALAVNHITEEIDLEATMQAAVINALFLVGAVKIGLNTSSTVELGGVTHDVGQVFVDCIDFDDLILDLHAKRVEQMQFMGNRYRLTKREMMDSGLFKPDWVEKACATDDMNLIRDEVTGQERLQAMSQSTSDPAETFEPTFELWDLWLPGRNLCITVVPGKKNLPPGRTVEWQGPEKGPYLVLNYGDVPGNVMPLAPRCAVIELHDALNIALRKLIRQAQREKTVLAAPRGSTHDAETMKEAGDGEVVGYDGPPGGLQPVTMNALNANLQGFFLYLKQLASETGGNLDALAGLGPMAETATQDELIHSSASRQVADLAERTLKFAKRILRQVAHYTWYDPLGNTPIVKTVEGVRSAELAMRYTPDLREGDLLDYNTDIDPFSMKSQTPQERMNAIMQLTTQLILPALPFLPQAGLMFDWNEFFDTISRYGSLPELKHLLKSLPDMGMGMMPQQGGMGGEGPGKSPVTTRNYTRTNRPGATKQGQEAAMAQMLMGGNPQQAEKAALMRPAGV